MTRMHQAIAAAAIDAITITGDGEVLRRYLFGPDFLGFSGHFPGYPVLPAIVQLLTVVSLAGEQAGTPLRLAAVEDAKFLTPVRPGQEILVQYRQRRKADRELYDARLTVAGKPAATFLIELVKEEP